MNTHKLIYGRFTMKGLSSLSLVLLSALLSFSLSSCHKSEKKAQGTPSIDVEQVMEDSIVVHQSFPAVLSAASKTDVVAQINGKMLTCNYKSGEFVEKGQVLFTFESTTYRDAVKQAEAALATARSQYDYAKSQYAAMSKALEADAVSKMEVLQAESSMEQAKAAISQAEATLSTARQNLGYCTVTAPISGYITANTLDPGSYVAGGGSPVVLASIYNNNFLTAIFSLSEEQYEKLVLANGGISAPIYRTVPVTFKQNLSQAYTADLNYEAPVVERSTGTMTMKGRILNPSNELKDGMYVTVELPTGVSPKALLVKDASIGSDQLGSYLYLVNDSNKVVYTPVKTGELYQDSLRVILEGVRPGDRYVSKALLTVRAGEKINPVMAGSKKK